MAGGRAALVAVVMMVLVACSAGAEPAPSERASPDPSDSAPSMAAVTPSETALVATDNPMATPSDSPLPAGSPAASQSEGLLVGRVVRSLADEGLRVRTTPGTEDDATRLEPLLPLGTRMLVLDGPVWASGYPWYDVMPLPFVWSLPSGWVAAAGKGGEPWVKAVTFDCPSVPTDFATLAALPAGVGLVCFPRVPITVEARVISCNCSVTGPCASPSWFAGPSGELDLLVEAKTTDVPADPGDWFALSLDPAGQHPAVVPEGKLVRVTGMFDHPAAADCTISDDGKGNPFGTPWCRTEFAVTRLVEVGR